jgi:hypothetical protein
MDGPIIVASSVSYPERPRDRATPWKDQRAAPYFPETWNVVQLNNVSEAEGDVQKKDPMHQLEPLAYEGPW